MWICCSFTIIQCGVLSSIERVSFSGFPERCLARRRLWWRGANVADQRRIIANDPDTMY